MGETPSNPSTDLAKSYGSNWTKTNVTTLFEWLAISSYNIKALELSILYYRGILRRSTIYGLFVSTLSGTLSVAQYNLTSGSLTSDIFKYMFTFLTFTIAIFTGYLKVYQIQEQLEHFIKMKQDWIVFSTAIASELQLPTELRRDALFIIMKNKNIYLDLLKVDVEIMTSIKKQAMSEITFPKELELHVATLPEIILDIGTQEFNDFNTDSARAKDRFTSPTKNAVIAATMAALMKDAGGSQNSPGEHANAISMLPASTVAKDAPAKGGKNAPTGSVDSVVPVTAVTAVTGVTAIPAIPAPIDTPLKGNSDAPAGTTVATATTAVTAVTVEIPSPVQVDVINPLANNKHTKPSLAISVEQKPDSPPSPSSITLTVQ